jgi:TonB family protein
MAKYRGLFLLISVIMWAGILYAVSKVKPTLMEDIFGEEKVIKADKDKKPPPPPPPPSCTEAPSQARKLRPFNIERAYPQRAIDRGQEGSVNATLQISETGDVVGVVINSENPPGVFGSAVDREARRMKFTPARRDCANVSDTFPLPVVFKLDE